MTPKGQLETPLPPRERILAAADELFHKQGIRGVGVEAIAEAAGTIPAPAAPVMPVFVAPPVAPEVPPEV